MANRWGNSGNSADFIFGARRISHGAGLCPSVLSPIFSSPPLFYTRRKPSRLLSANIGSSTAISGSPFVRSHPYCRAEMHSVRNAFPSCHRQYSASHRRVLFRLQRSDKVSPPVGIAPKLVVSKLSISTRVLAFVLCATQSILWKPRLLAAADFPFLPNDLPWSQRR